MNPAWHQFLRQSGANVESESIADFGNPVRERETTRLGSVLAVLSHLAVLEFSGEDAASFLQGQLSCDVKAVAPGASALGAYCSPKGRMLASFVLVRDARNFLLVLSRTISASIQKRLSMFVLRAKVKIADASECHALLGASGPATERAFSAYLGAGFKCGVQDNGSTLVEIMSERKLLIVPAEAAAEAWKILTGGHLMPVGTACWEWLDIRHGIPFITASTQDQLVPQMTNLDLLGGVSFSKGCYPGQEIVARTQHLGKVKRRMFLAKTITEPRPLAGDELYCDDLGDQASGIVINAQVSPDGGYDLLAVAPVASKLGSTVRLRSGDGPPLRFEPLSYEVA